MCIIMNMPPQERTEKMTIRLTPDEARLRDALADHLGVDASGVMRQGLLKLAREEGVTVPEARHKPSPKPKPRGR